MKRTKLSTLAPGSILPSPTWYEVPRCFACDDPIKSHRFSTSLLLGHTQYSHSSIPGKLGEYIGDGFVVVVTSEDALCRNCMNLLNTMDRLEEELKEHRTRLVGNLRRKYGLDPGGNQAVPKSNKKHTQPAEDDILEVQSDEEWTPYNKKRKVTSSNSSRSKALICNVCKMEFHDLSRFMTHLKLHKDLKDRVSTPKEPVIESDVPKSFKCGCCSLSFDKKEVLAAHMKLHTGEKTVSRPMGAATQSESTSLLKSNFPLSSNNGNKLFPKPTSQTVVEMKLIMGDGQNASSTAVPRQISQPLEKPVTVTKVTGKDSGGKVCLLALWNSGSCTDHTDCQDPLCAPASNASNDAINTHKTPEVAQEETIIPRFVVKPARDGVPGVVVSHPGMNISNVLSQSQFQITTSVSNVSSISQANTHIVTIPHTVHPPAQIPVSIKGSSQPVSQIVISVPNQNTSSQQTTCSVQEKHYLNANPPANQEMVLNTSDDVLPRAAVENVQISLKDKKSETLSSTSVNELSSSSFEGQLSNVNLVTEGTISREETIKGNKSMPSLDDDNDTVVEAVSTERTVVEQDEMGNIAIVNVSTAGDSDTSYNAKDDTDWFLASQQSNAVLEPPHTHSLWTNPDNLNSGLVSIDQVDGMRSSMTLPSEVKEQNDSVDEDEKSEYFTSRYAVDALKLRQEAEALADAIYAAMKS